MKFTHFHLARNSTILMTVTRQLHISQTGCWSVCTYHRGGVVRPVHDSTRPGANRLSIVSNSEGSSRRRLRRTQRRRTRTLALFFVVSVDLREEGRGMRASRERITAIISTRIQLFTPRDCCWPSREMRGAHMNTKCAQHCGQGPWKCGHT